MWPQTHRWVKTRRHIPARKTRVVLLWCVANRPRAYYWLAANDLGPRHVTPLRTGASPLRVLFCIRKEVLLCVGCGRQRISRRPWDIITQEILSSLSTLTYETVGAHVLTRSQGSFLPRLGAKLLFLSCTCIASIWRVRLIISSRAYLVDAKQGQSNIQICSLHTCLLSSECSWYVCSIVCMQWIHTELATPRGQRLGQHQRRTKCFGWVTPTTAMNFSSIFFDIEVLSNKTNNPLTSHLSKLKETFSKHDETLFAKNLIFSSCGCNREHSCVISDSLIHIPPQASRFIHRPRPLSLGQSASAWRTPGSLELYLP